MTTIDPPALPVLLTVTQTARALQVHEDTVLTLVHKGLLAGSRIGHRRGVLRITEASVVALIERGRVAPPVSPEPSPEE